MGILRDQMVDCMRTRGYSPLVLIFSAASLSLLAFFVLLGIAVGTCKAQLHRARALLSARLGETEWNHDAG